MAVLVTVLEKQNLFLATFFFEDVDGVMCDVTVTSAQHNESLWGRVQCPYLITLHLTIKRGGVLRSCSKTYGYGACVCVGCMLNIPYALLGTRSPTSERGPERGGGRRNTCSLRWLRVPLLPGKHYTYYILDVIDLKKKNHDH